MIDSEGYRLNVGIVICNQERQVLWARRFGQNSWQFPQGGMKQGESTVSAMYRELKEEIGLMPEDVKILYELPHWLKYNFPKKILRNQDSNCIGQKQRWFLLQLESSDSAINLDNVPNVEFDDWRWVSFWYPVRQVVSFKKEVYRTVMKNFSAILFHKSNLFAKDRAFKPYKFKNKSPHYQNG